MATRSWRGTCEKMLVACSTYHSVTAWVALVKFQKAHAVPLRLHCGGRGGPVGVGAADRAPPLRVPSHDPVCSLITPPAAGHGGPPCVVTCPPRATQRHVTTVCALVRHQPQTPGSTQADPIHTLVTSHPRAPEQVPLGAHSHGSLEAAWASGRLRLGSLSWGLSDGARDLAGPVQPRSPQRCRVAVPWNSASRWAPVGPRRGPSFWVGGGLGLRVTALQTWPVPGRVLRPPRGSCLCLGNSGFLYPGPVQTLWDPPVGFHSA